MTRHIRALHVEDDEMARKIVDRLLARIAGYTFTIDAVAAEDEAVALAEQHAYDLVLLDYQLAGGDGLSCLARLRQRDPRLPIIAISGVASSDVVARIRQAGADDYLVKQSDLWAQFVPRVEAVLARAGAGREASP